MSLIAHYNLNGNAKDHFGNDGVPSNVAWVDGKVGLASSATSGASRISIPALQLPPTFSIAFWHYSGSNGSTSWRTFLGTDANVHPLIAQNQVNLGIFDGTFRSFGYSLTTNVWTHIAVVYELSVNSMHLYINGSYNSSITSTTYNQVTNPVTTICGAGGQSYGPSDNDDFRIYDHALSEREVRDLSRGIVANYSFDRKAEYTENMYADGSYESGIRHPVNSGNFDFPIDPTNRYDGNVLRVSPRGSNSYHGRDIPIVNGDSYSYHIMCYVSPDFDGTSVTLYGEQGFSGGRADYDLSKKGRWQQLVVENEIATTTNGRLLIYILSSFTTGYVLYKNIQVEKRTFITDFAETTREAFVSDNSGNGNVAVLDNLCPQWISGDNVSFGAYKFNGSNTYIVTNTQFDKEDFTYAAWVNLTQSSGGWENIIDCWESSSAEWARLSIYNGNIRFSVDNNGTLINIDGGTLPVGSWHHLAGIRSGNNMFLYFDGELVQSGVHTQSGVIEGRTPEAIGAHSINKTENFNGKITGVKIYATGLSGEDVKQEYQTGLAVDDHHRMHSAYLNELFEFDYLSPKSSSEVASAGNGYNATSGESDPCSGLLTFDEAVAYAESLGARLPTKDELENDATVGSGCGYDNQLCWSCTKGVDDSEHWVVKGFSTSSLTGSPAIHKNTETAYVRFVYDNDLDRPDPVTIDDAAVQKVVGSGATKVERGSTKKDQFSEVGITRGLEAFYPLSNNVKDISGNNHNGVNQGATLTGTFIDGSPAYEFDGSGTVDGVTPGDHIDVPESITNTNNYPDGCTYSFWLNVDTDAVNRMSLFYGSSTIRHIEINSTDRNFRTEAATQNGYSFGAGTFPDNVRGEWAHFAIVFANGEANRPVRWYQNGKLFHTGSMDGGTNPGDEYFSFSKIGRSTGTTTYTYAKSLDGQFTNFKIFAKPLTPEEVAQEYSASTKASINKSTAFAKEFIEV